MEQPVMKEELSTVIMVTGVYYAPVTTLMVKHHTIFVTSLDILAVSYKII